MSLLVLVAAGILGVVVIARPDDKPTYASRFSAAGFGIAVVGSIERARGQRRFEVIVTEGVCSKFDRFRARRTTRTVTVWAQMRDQILPPGHGCPALGFERQMTLTLAEPTGNRALIIYHGPYDFRRVIIPPRGRAAVRGLVLPIRLDRRQPPPLVYSGPACDAVARYLRDVRRSEWC
ncbi:hypothetical protein DVA67_011930 [Solirubrobacter sp. CPCC 204708]|uniref:DUF3592 domain-containing protein n=1 Tax=Solirubrobacter deserti TaxID=2282478 RepID=A0ABT4RLL3_9ACTN|nr:hypothetical protein [Solirubrobacter deserti]MBE2316686.1 hypothetical protein [Solirubrobacter deserti]MDA0139443.1 hypothetical protein [Solirubrobacter deserti]